MDVGRRYEVQGIVQGVGFRPFVYRLAHKHRLHGYVCNTGGGILIEIEGPGKTIELFDAELRTQLPSLARIDRIIVSESDPKPFGCFEIRESQNTSKRALISPDIAVCEQCLSEMRDPDNRRYGYYLINCTECGPRYSIMKTVPYDRKMTSMEKFELCEACQREYEDPLNRRYHAEPISCHQCGPRLILMDNQRTCLAHGDAVIALMADYLKQGSIVALKGIGGFHLICSAANEAAVATLRRRKKRPKKPLAVMFGTMDQLKHYLRTGEKEEVLLRSKERPIVVLEKKKGSDLASSIAPDINTIGAMLAYAPIHHLLFELCDFPLVATSANKSEEPIIFHVDALQERLADVADVIVDYDRDILNASDDSLLQVISNRVVVLRLGRGYTPYALSLNQKVNANILAVGAQQKNTIGLAFDDTMIFSPHIGELHSLEGMEYFERTVETFSRFYDFTPDVIVCDKHPSYATAQWAKERGVSTLLVQHHYAHVLACMAEFGLDEKVLAFSFDGTGYGEDGTLWGGEVFIADTATCQRIGHLQPFPLLGGENAIKEPKRVALSLLFSSYGVDGISELDLALFNHFTPLELEVYAKMFANKVHAPLCSSMGRLFDGVASLCDLLHQDGYEGEGGRRLETLYDRHIDVYFGFTIDEGVVDVSLMIREMVQLAQRKEYSVIATGFINTLAAIVETFVQEHRLPVVFSGGVFQNRTLLALCVERCEAKGHRVYFQQQTPINDGGIALGQLYYAHHHVRGNE